MCKCQIYRELGRFLRDFKILIKLDDELGEKLGKINIF